MRNRKKDAIAYHPASSGTLFLLCAVGILGLGQYITDAAAVSLSRDSEVEATLSFLQADSSATASFARTLPRPKHGELEAATARLRELKQNLIQMRVKLAKLLHDNEVKAEAPSDIRIERIKLEVAIASAMQTLQRLKSEPGLPTPDVPLEGEPLHVLLTGTEIAPIEGAFFERSFEYIRDGAGGRLPIVRLRRIGSLSMSEFDAWTRRMKDNKKKIYVKLLVTSSAIDIFWKVRKVLVDVGIDHAWDTFPDGDIRSLLNPDRDQEQSTVYGRGVGR